MSTIKSSTTTTTAYSVTADTTGALVIQTGATPTTALTISSAQVVTLAQVLPEASGGTGTSTGYYGFKNRIINGGFAVSQYNGTSSFTATTGGLRYGIDRFFMFCSGANLTGQQVTGTNTGTYRAWRITGATGSTLLNFAQRIESLNTTDLASQSVTVSVKVYCSTAVSGASVYAIVPSAQDNYASNTTSFSTGITLSAGLNNIVVTGTIGSAGANGVEIGIGFSSGVGNGVTVEVGNFQLEKGSTATSFDYRPYGTELALCQRYAASTFPIGTAWGQNRGASGCLIVSSPGAGVGYGVQAPFRFPVTMRTTPTTITTYNPSAANANARYFPGSSDLSTSGLPFSQNSMNSVCFVPDTAGTSVGAAIGLHISVEAEL